MCTYVRASVILSHCPKCVLVGTPELIGRGAKFIFKNVSRDERRALLNSVVLFYIISMYNLTGFFFFFFFVLHSCSLII